MRDAERRPLQLEAQREKNVQDDAGEVMSSGHTGI
jgi:hypothetical protein